MALLRLFTTVVFILSVAFVNAQRLPNKQSTSEAAPADIKIDGKATEWGSGFKAFNRATGIYYTIANNDNYLYFLIQARDPFIINKIYAGGLTLIVSVPGQKKERAGLYVTYPVYESGKRFHLKVANKPHGGADAAAFVKAANQAFTSTATAIRIGGAGIADTLISIYNDDGIRAIAQFDGNLYYTCEVAIGRRALEGIVKDGKIAYHMILQPITAKTNDNISSHMGIGPTGAPIRIVTHDIPIDMSSLRILGSVTDMRGEYTFAGKP